ncbi:hypothetical protein FE784_38475 [Paenibacillus hemerocallicola]|jgi:hypothetical protein|uniref:Uncharacterized protein n=1 Tax=Paenibacillus hemerocallicola TaxID=1172614 RepID=A0A5C4SWQ2_9BACL|nr:hypothetical protein [Paenibacillus hemerocallicola]TNJ57654.1 hypothetical protein FE784_38475 [Paenibacillus hemerocallicola]
MSGNQLVKALGMICLLAGIARIGMTPSSIIWGTDSVQELTFGFIACVLMSVGTIVTYMVQSRETGWTGFATTLAIIIGNIVTTAMLWSGFASGDPHSIPEGVLVTVSRMITMIGLMGGTVVFAILTFRAKVFPRWVAGLLLLMIVGLFLPLEDNKWFAFFWGLAYVGMGYCIWAEKLNTSSAKTGADRTASL